MSNVFDKFKYFMGLEDYEEDDYDFENYDDIEEEVDIDMFENDDMKMNNTNNNVVSIHSKENNMKIVIHQPKSYEEAPKVVDDLKSKKVAVVNFEHLDAGLKRQIFDFVNGALYSMEGKIQKVTKDIFIVAPKTVQIDGLQDELKTKGIFTW